MSRMTSNRENHKLEQLYNSEIKLDVTEDKRCSKVLNKVLATVLATAKEKSSDFKELYRETYYGGSYYDGLKVKSTDFEYDLNIVFLTPKTSWALANLGDDVRKPNFANITSNHLSKDHPSAKAFNNLLVKDRQGNWAISPKKMFEVLQKAIDRALTDMNKTVDVDGEAFAVTRAIGAPVILIVKGPGVNFTVDLVPSFKLELSHLQLACPDLKERLDGILRNGKIEVKDFMAIALKNASSDMFEVDFHDVERGILKSTADDTGTCIYKVIMLIKYLRDQKGGTMSKLWSHLLKVSLTYHNFKIN